MGLVFSRIQKYNGVENSLIRLKKSTGSAFAISSMMLESGFKVEEGELDATTLPKGSGSGYKPFFCKKCGTYIYCEYERVPGIIL